MSNFDTDLNRHIAAYEQGERLDEIEREMRDESSDWHIDGEAARLIPAPGEFGSPTIWDDREVLGEES